MTVETLQFGGTADDIPAVGELNMWHDENEKVRCMPVDLSARTVPVAANSKNRRAGGVEATAEGKSCGFTASPLQGRHPDHKLKDSDPRAVAYVAGGYLADGSTLARRVSDADKRASDYDRQCRAHPLRRVCPRSRTVDSSAPSARESS